MFEVPVQLMVALAIGASASPLAPSDARLAPLARIEQARAPGPARAAADAVGPYLFRDEIWLQSIRRIEGLGVASHVFTTSTGRAYVPNAEHRARLLALRTDMGLAEALAIDTARRNAIALAGMIGRMPTAGELLIAHLFGAAKASLVISAAARAPATRIDAVAGLLPEDVALLARLVPDEHIGTACRRIAGTVDDALARVAARKSANRTVARSDD